MYLTATAKNLMLDSVDESITGGLKYASLHTAYSTTGTNEVTGGSPAYARIAATWNAASAGSKALSGALSAHNVPAATDVAWVGFFDALTTGTFLGMVPNGGGALKPFQAESGDVTANTLGAKGHGFSAGDTVVVWGANLPTGLVQGTTYYVIAAGLATDVLSLSATSGGAAIDITATGGGFLQKIVVEHFSAQGTFTVSSASIDLGAVA